MPDIIKNNILERMKDPVFRDDLARKTARIFIIQDGHDLSSFTDACRRNHVELLDLRPTSSNIQEMGLIAAIKNGSHDCIDKLLEMGVNTYHGLGSAFHEAIKSKDFESFQKLDTEQKAIEKYGTPLLQTAVEQDDAEAIHFLVKSGAKIEYCHHELLRTCMEPKDTPIRTSALEAVMHYILSPNFKYLGHMIDLRKDHGNKAHIAKAEEIIKKSKARRDTLSHLHMMKNDHHSITTEKAKITCAKIFQMATANTPQIPPSVAEQLARMKKPKEPNLFWKKHPK